MGASLPAGVKAYEGALASGCWREDIQNPLVGAGSGAQGTKILLQAWHTTSQWETHAHREKACLRLAGHRKTQLRYKGQASAQVQKRASVQAPDRRALRHPTMGEETYETSSGSTYQCKSQRRHQNKRAIPQPIVKKCIEATLQADVQITSGQT
eukprot:2211191-Amphidinium_carterae.2